MNKKYIKDEIVRTQGRIAGIWAIIHSNNYLIKCYTKSGQDYNVSKYKQENYHLINDAKELTREYKFLQNMLNKKPVYKKPVENLIYLNQFGFTKGIKKEELTQEMIEREEELGQEMYERQGELMN